MLWLMLATAIFIWAMLLIISDNAERWMSQAVVDKLYTEYNDSTTEDGFGAMKSINPDFYGWLRVGELSTPVVKGEDNVKYLTATFDGRQDKRGTIFADFRNSRLGGSEPIVLYGHNFTSSGEMFAVVEKLTDIDYLAKNPYIYLELENEARRYVIYTLFYADANAESTDYFPYNDLPFSDDADALDRLFKRDRQARNIYQQPKVERQRQRADTLHLRIRLHRRANSGSRQAN